MSRALGSIFGMTVRVADSEAEWIGLVELAREQGGVPVGDAEGADYSIVIDESQGLVVAKDRATMQRLIDAIPLVSTPDEREP